MRGRSIPNARIHSQTLWHPLCWATKPWLATKAIWEATTEAMLGGSYGDPTPQNPWPRSSNLFENLVWGIASLTYWGAPSCTNTHPQPSQHLIHNCTNPSLQPWHMIASHVLSLTWPKVSDLHFGHSSLIGHLYLRPWVRSHFHSLGLHPSHTSFVARSSSPHLRGNQCDNTRPKLQIFNLTSLYYSQVNWWSSFTCQRSLWLKWPCHVTLIPNMEEFLCRCGLEDQAVKEAWEGRGPAKWICDIAWGINWFVVRCRSKNRH